MQYSLIEPQILSLNAIISFRLSVVEPDQRQQEFMQSCAVNSLKVVVDSQFKNNVSLLLSYGDLCSQLGECFVELSF